MTSILLSRTRPTCFSDSPSLVAISIRLSLDRYILKANDLSSSSSCVLVNAVRMRLEDGRSSEGPFTPEDRRGGGVVYWDIWNIGPPIITNLK